MSTLEVGAAQQRLRTRVDLASRILLRAVMADEWRAEEAARELLGRVRGDVQLLKVLRARIARAMLERPTRIGARAAATVDHALCAAEAARGLSASPQPVSAT